MFFLTTSKEKAFYVTKEYKNLYRTVDIFEYFGIFIITTSNTEKNCIIKNFGESAIFIFGTIFDDHFFNQELLDTYNCFDDFSSDIKKEKKTFFGHYVVILLNASKKIVEVFSDKIGLINTYYTIDKGKDAYISDDLIELSKVSENGQLYSQAVYEFVLTESNVGKFSIFKNVYRLELGKQLVLKNNVLKEENIYEYKIEKLSEEEYIKRVEEYFKCFNNYKGKICTDVSAGYDTRLINSIAHKTINQFEGFNNANERDGGCDKEISKIIAQVLGIKLHSVEYSKARKCNKSDYMTVLRETTVMRDAKRSQRLTILMEEKYKECDLAIGGYGGESVRAKYNKYENIKDFIYRYYKGNEAEKVCGFKNYSINLEKELNEYRLPINLDKYWLQNWYYSVAKMRIWGAGFIHLSFLYGNVVHPFMDWHLLNPLFGFTKEELQEAKLQLKLISIFTPELSGLPINAKMDSINKKKTLKELTKKRVEHVLVSSGFFYCLYCRYRNIKEKQNDIKLEEIPEDLLRDEEINVRKMLSCNGEIIAQRMKTVISAYKNAK